MSVQDRVELKSFDKLFIGGEWVEPAGDARIDVISPSTEERIAQVPEASNADVDRAVVAARKAFDEGPWAGMSGAERGQALERIADLLVARAEEFAVACSLELGSPIVESRGMMEMSEFFLRTSAGFQERVGVEQRRDSVEGESLILREPFGVAAAICPWNGPVAAICMKAAPALAAGCTVVVKPSPEACASTLMFAELIEEAGLPEGVVSILPAGREVGQHLVEHAGIDKISFTGSTDAGRKVMAAAAGHVVSVTLELGGKSAGIVADDIPIDEVIPTLVPWSMSASGQNCVSTTRYLISRKRHDEFVAAVAERMESFKVGDPLDEATEVGPLVSERQRDRVQSYIAVGKEEGAELATGGGNGGMEKGWYVEPTLFAKVDNNMRIAQEEIFGPVVAVIPYEDYDDAVRIANDTQYGLSGCVYSGDLELAESLARRMRTGQVFLNSASASIAEPFGGYGQSGLGRECGVEGVEEFLETKVIRAG